MTVTVFMLLATLCVAGLNGEDRKDAQTPGHVSVVVVGGTGDLAKKYLWQGFFSLYVDNVSSGNTFSFICGGLSQADWATPVFFEILKGLSCLKEVSQERCALLKEQFLRLSQYRQLKTLEQYQDLNKQIEQELRQEGMMEAGRLFYLSVPAFAYADVADKINSSCRPAGGAWLRVVLEKPFGHDLRSAQVLTAQLKGSLKEEEMYRIDHYLGKQVQSTHSVHSSGNLWLRFHFRVFVLEKAVAKILPFRMDNHRFLDPVWNKHHIERVEIVVKETLDVKGEGEEHQLAV